MSADPRSTSANLAESLLASGPATGHEKELMQFGRLAGHWLFEGVELAEDGLQTHDRGEIVIDWILGGRALQDVWRETDRSDGGPLMHGTTVRFYDASIGAWRSMWVEPVSGSIRTFVGHETGDGMMFEGFDGKGRPIRWIFSEVEPDSFMWRGERRNSQGSWQTYEELKAVRK